MSGFFIDKVDLENVMDTKKLSNNGITAFIDILGFSERIASIAPEDIAQSIKDIEELVTIFHKACGHGNETKDELCADMYSILGKNVLAFSDCVVVHVPLENSLAITIYNKFDLIIGELVEIAFAQTNCISQKNIFMRGAVDIGWWYQNESVLISQSLLRAYKMESNDVQYPVVALTDKLFEYLLECQMFPIENNQLEYPVKYPIEKLIRKKSIENKKGEINDIHYIDYINVHIDLVSNSQKCFSPEEYTSMFLKHHAKRISIEFANASCEKVKQKYIWLANYHNEVVNEREMDKSCCCNLF